MNSSLSKARKAKNDEFYTQYKDIECEIEAYYEHNQNVFADKTILLPCDHDWSNFTKYFNDNKARFRIKKVINVGDKDFRSPEVIKLRDEADIIITNPPFSLFREFLAWITEADKKFLIIGNLNAITYKEVFPLIKDNKIWLGPSITSGDREFAIPKEMGVSTKFTGEIRKDDKGNDTYYQRVPGIRWYTNLEHGRRHCELKLMTEADNLKYSKHKVIKENVYQKYDNYDAIEVPFTDSIPADYEGVMGVPISFLDKYCPEQFEILGNSNITGQREHLMSDIKCATNCTYINGIPQYARILIKHRSKQ